MATKIPNEAQTTILTLEEVRQQSKVSYRQYDPKKKKAKTYLVDHQIARLARLEKVRRAKERLQELKLIKENYISLREYIPQAWKIVEPRKRFMGNWHIDAIADHLMAVTKGDIQNLIINIAPRHMKSLSVAVMWPTWTWTTFPESRWIFSSYSQGLSTRDNIKCRTIIQSNWYQNRWGWLYDFKPDQNQKTRFENTKTGERIATSVGGSGTGEGGEYLIVDDPHNVKHIHSAVRREEVIQWWNTVMSTRLNDPKTGHKVIIAQRAHERDLVGSILANMRQAEELEEAGEEVDTYELLILPTEYEPRQTTSGEKPRTKIGFEDPRSEPGELIWPERFNQGQVNKLKKTLGEFGSSAQLQQTPTPSEGGIFKIAKFRCWQPEGQDLGPALVYDQNNQLIELPVIILPSKFDVEGLSLDAAFKDTQASSYVVLQRWAKVLANYFLLDQSRDHLDFSKTLALFKSSVERWPDARLRLIEDKANGTAVINTVQDQISGVIPVNPTDSKVARAYSIQPLQEAGNIVLPHPKIASWLQIFISEVITFPFAGNDDQTDSMTQFVNYCEQGPKVTISGPEPPDEEEQPEVYEVPPNFVDW